MSVPVVAFFNNQGGVGKTSLLYHVAWMLADLGINTVAADADPQANLTSAMLDDDRVEALTEAADQRQTVSGASALLKGSVGDVSDPYLAPITTNLGLVPGDMSLSTFEDDLSEVWPKCLSSDPRASRVTSALWRVFQRAAEARAAEVVLVDLGPNLGALNRSALVGGGLRRDPARARPLFSPRVAQDRSRPGRRAASPIRCRVVRRLTATLPIIL